MRVKTKKTTKAKRENTEKTAWKISPEISQSVLTIDTWKKGDLKIEQLKVYRSGWIIVDQLPDLSRLQSRRGCQHF